MLCVVDRMLNVYCWGAWSLRGNSLMYVTRRQHPLQGGQGGVGWCCTNGWYQSICGALSPGIGGGGLCLGILPLFYMAFNTKFSAKFRLPFDLVGPVCGTHRSTCNVFGVTGLKPIAPAGVFFGLTLFFGVSFDALLTESNGLYLSARFGDNDVRFGGMAWGGFGFVVATDAGSC